MHERVLENRRFPATLPMQGGQDLGWLSRHHSKDARLHLSLRSDTGTYPPEQLPVRLDEKGLQYQKLHDRPFLRNKVRCAE
jgi:hypothetical protein